MSGRSASQPTTGSKKSKFKAASGGSSSQPNTGSKKRQGEDDTTCNWDYIMNKGTPS